MKTTKGIKPSKKYYKGAIHEFVTGKFEILDRFVEDNQVMLTYRMLDTGEVITNKEVNVASNLHKFRMKREADLLRGDATIQDLVGVTPEHSYKAIMDELKVLGEQMRLMSIQQAVLLNELNK